MAAFLQENLHVVRFAYGLVFFALGFAIVLQPRRHSVYYLSTALSWLAAFALVHAFADWGLVFIPNGVDEEQIRNLLTLRGIGVLVSFGLLMQFGVALLTHDRPRERWLQLLPSIVTGLFLFLQMMEHHSAELGRAAWLADTKVTGRYFLGLPAALLSAWGLITQGAILRREKLGQHIGHLYGAAVCLVLYGVVGGLVVPARGYFPANIMNDRFFFESFGLPVEVARGIAILGVTYFIVRLLDIFYLETQRRLQAAERERALLRERERIARELHDGIMQTLYGTGLGLKQVMSLAVSQPDAAGTILTELNREIGRSIVQMRSFVLDLKEELVSGSDLADQVEAMTTEVSQYAGIPLSVEVEAHASDCRIPAGIREEVIAVLREGLSNIVRHSEASSGRILLSLEDCTILLRITDDGKGFDPPQLSGQGLGTLRERVEALGGFVTVLSAPGKGAQLIAHLPLTPSGSGNSRKEQSA